MIRYTQVRTAEHADRRIGVNSRFVAIADTGVNKHCVIKPSYEIADVRC
jgi:hypothetical protein